MDEVGLGKSLQKARQTAGLTQQELCQKAGLSYSTLAKIERGAIKAPSVFTIQTVATVLGLTLNDLMGGVTPRVPAVPVIDLKKISKSGVKFVYFDINGCLVRFFHRAFTALAEETGAQPDVIETTFWHYNDAVCRGDISLEQFNTEFAAKLGVKEIDWRRHYIGAVDPIDEMQELVKWAGEHYQIGLLSNIMPGFIDEMMKQRLLPHANYKAIIDSSVAKAIKPEIQIYETAEAAAGVKPEEILLIDDARANLITAERRGWHVLWFDDYRPTESVDRVRRALEF